MAILNITESPYNAVGDGVNDDSQAIMDAINDTTDGDTVFIPDGDYLLTQQFDYDNDGNFRSAFQMQSKHAGYSFTIEGEGANTVLRQDEDVGTIFHFPTEQGEPDKWNITMRNMVMDGNGNAISSDPMVWLETYNGRDNSPGHSIHFEDIHFKDSNRALIMSSGSANQGISTVTGKRLTITDADRFGIAVNSTQEASNINQPDDIINRFESIYTDRTASEDFGSTLHANGPVVFRDLYCHEGRNANKISNDNTYLYVENATFENFTQDSSNGTWEESVGGRGTDGDKPYTFHFDTVAFRNIPSMGGIRTGNEDRGELITSGPLEFTNVNAYAIRALFGDAANSTVGDVLLKDQPDTSFAELDGDGTADTINYENTPGTILDDGWTANNLNQQNITQLDTPNQNDVGAFTGDDNGDNG